MWQLSISPAARRDLRSLDPPIAARVVQALEHLAATGRGDVTHLSIPLHGAEYRLRVGDWRVLFNWDVPTMTVLVARVRHRREVYRDR